MNHAGGLLKKRLCARRGVRAFTPAPASNRLSDARTTSARRLPTMKPAAALVGDDREQLWVPPGLTAQQISMNSGAPASVSSGGYDEHRYVP